MALPVSDSLSNVNEQIEAAAKVLGRSKHAHLVFDAIYFGKKNVKTVEDISKRTGLDRKQVLTQGKKFAANQIVKQVKVNRQTAYEKIPFFHQNKSKILGLASDPKRLAQYPTKRKAVTEARISVKLDRSKASIHRITIDDISSFSAVKSIDPSGFLGTDISEEVFKKGIQSIIGEPGEYKDWGGERNDLYSSRVWVGKQRLYAAFAFKGPGARGILTPAKMGKNADQIQRLFEVDADVFIVQYWRDISHTVIQQMEAFAIAKSTLGQKEIWYGIIDGVDSRRIFLAYPDYF